MTVESATYLNTLNDVLPADTDPVAEGKLHLRLIKEVLQATFPNLSAAVTASASDLNSCTGLASGLAAFEDTAVLNTGAQNIAGSLTVSGALSATSLQIGGVPWPFSGMITMWAGSASAIPAGWALCNGLNGTPNLQDRFVVGAGDVYSVGSTGGYSTSTITTATAGLHNHGASTGLAGAHSHGGNTDTQGTHTHTGSTGSYSLQVADIPPHVHNVGGISNSAVSSGGWLAGSGRGYVWQTNQTQSTGGGGPHNHTISSDGAHVHNIYTDTAATHGHTISSDGLHSHVFTIDQRPPFYALCFIMKL